MDIRVALFPLRIEGYINGSRHISVWNDGVQLSTCLPVDLDRASEFVDLYRACIDKYLELKVTLK